MESLWNRLRPEYKQKIEEHKKNYTSAPHNLEKKLRNETVFTHLNLNELQALFMWTDNDLTEMEWQDTFGDKFLISKTK